MAVPLGRFCAGESAPQKRKNPAWRPSDAVLRPCCRRTSANERLVSPDPEGRQSDHPLMASARRVMGMPAGAPAASRASPRHHGQQETGSMSTSIPLWLHDQARIVPSRAIPLNAIGVRSRAEATKPLIRLTRKIAIPAPRPYVERAGRIRWNACGRGSHRTLFCARAASGPVVFVSVARAGRRARRGATYSGCRRHLLVVDEPQP